MTISHTHAMTMLVNLATQSGPVTTELSVSIEAAARQRYEEEMYLTPFPHWDDAGENAKIRFRTLVAKQIARALGSAAAYRRENGVPCTNCE